MNAIAVFVIILCVLQFALDKVILTSDRKISDTEVGKVYNWILIILVILLIASIFLTPMDEPNLIFDLLITFICAYRAFMEWKYNKESKGYIVQLASLIVSILFTIIVFSCWLIY
ncbi:DUF4181 domain-containing protein [Paenibacillus glacialis]|uniref:DUF4181 domain-containing protein n=1 Tax=Paenibacillus glacialis TaxID=494026 RepID=A0A168HLU3_9BACL|nr:DUF4181 domain-containing protein [Paenibacillus glacialis]OAB38317.1 hypothetical protein PGLA_19640 [Paenibacillus glacialis]